MATIKDISKITGLSISIISRFLNGHNVRKENRIAIEEAIRKTNYIPNESARVLRAERTKLVGAIIPNMKSNFPLSVLAATEEYLNKNGYTFFLMSCHANEDDEFECVRNLIQRKVEAIVMLPIGNCENIRKLCNEKNIPLFIFDHYIEGCPDVDFILFENKLGAQKATDILLDADCKNVALLMGPKQDYTPTERLKGYLESLKNHGIEPNEEFILVNKDYSMESSYELVKSFFLKGNKPDAIFATNFDMTLGAIRAINELNLKIPDDISVMAFDSLPVYKVLKPQLWTLNQPTDKVGKEIGVQVISHIENKITCKGEKHFISYEIQEGASIKGLGKQNV